MDARKRYKKYDNPDSLLESTDRLLDHLPQRNSLPGKAIGMGLHAIHSRNKRIKRVVIDISTFLDLAPSLRADSLDIYKKHLAIPAIACNIVRHTFGTAY
ncbi:hypothetical protein R0381_000715 [Jeongeupia wiesaeckerbachi]|uniref:hypothetical protein n=1 Tax=Jeongeupia wiesaeckerbachi TaxID=3051218 RepID=UPI003D801025